MSKYPDEPGFVKDSDTSEAAAVSMAGPAVAIRIACLRHVEAAERSDPPGLTCDDVEALTGGRHQTISARIRDLVIAGLIYDTKVRRRTRSGRTAVVYRPVDLAAPPPLPAPLLPSDPTLF